MTIWLTCYKFTDEAGRPQQRRTKSFESIELALEYMDRVCEDNTRSKFYAFEVEVQE